MRKVLKGITAQLRITNHVISLLNYCDSLKVETAQSGWLYQQNIAKLLLITISMTHKIQISIWDNKPLFLSHYFGFYFQGFSRLFYKKPLQYRR